MIEAMKKLAVEVRKMLEAGKTLREVMQWSFAQREAGLDVPYLGATDEDATGVTALEARPTKKQALLSKFFDEAAPGCKALRRYRFRVEATGVNFTERLSKTEVVDLF